ncbi:winged helix-turn-helix domain-containing protein [Streptomyces sp. HD]|uniref:winged helix-turn-helix domain-containing protein n=1 Tax=Streptomyces sp. HD TaxID=3020892 RepID=UPI00232FF7B9|nr:winged helix-turn-helix domain-containing protein [Streptomyces sp. HD]MDC0766123.1 winged helix-turn-helix domain-containing protein [Streptomyces sp. HD]
MGIQVLLIEDDETIAEPLIEGLAHFGLTVDHVTTGTEGLRRPYGDVVLLDLGLPDMDGIDVCRGIRKLSDVPVIILSARGEEADRVLGLELGADDYLAKPFSVRELVARVRAVTRRTQRMEAGAEPVRAETPAGSGRTEALVERLRAAAGAEPEPMAIAPPAPLSFEAVPSAPLSFEATPPPPLSYEAAPPPPSSHEAAPPPSYDDTAPQPPYAPGPLVVDRRTRQVWVGEVPVTLTPKEFELLALLAEDPGAVYSRQQILDRVWDPHYEGPTKTLDVHVASLRRKLGDPAWIQTLRGVGFRLAVQTEPGGQQVSSP